VTTVKVTLPDITTLLNSASRSDMRSVPSAVADGSGNQRSEPPAVAGGPKHSSVTWKRLAYDVNGEWGTYLLLDQFLKSPAESHRAAAGWAGDRYAVYESSSGQVVYVSVSAWDTDNDAREFFEAYGKRTDLWYQLPVAVLMAVPPGEKLATRTWNTKEGNVTAKLDGQRVIIIEGYPAMLTVQRLINALSQ